MVDLHDRLDQYAREYQARCEYVEPLRPDTRLWNLFAEDRESYRGHFCPGCGRETRPPETMLADHPGTVVASTADGTCRSCYRRTERTGAPSGLPPGTPCRTCGQPMRPKRRKVIDFPGTRRHEGNGLCSRCAAAVKRQKKAERMQA